MDPIATPILPFSLYLWLAVIVSYFASIVCYKILKVCQGYVEGSLNDESSEETISEIFLHILGIFVLQSVKMKCALCHLNFPRKFRI